MARKRIVKSPPVSPELPVEGETRRQRFERIGAARMARVLNSIRLLGNLASPNYEYSVEDVNKMQNTIVDVLGQTLGRFSKRKRGEKITFNFEKQDEEQF